MSKKRQKGEPAATASPNLVGERLKQLRELFPDAISDGRVGVEKLRSALGEIADERPERYSFTWAGKRDAIRLLQTPSRATLVPSPDESVNFDTTQNIFIEGDKPILYLVSETKSSTSKDDMRPDEWRKIQCGAAHFGSKHFKKKGVLEEVDYVLVASAKELQ